MLVKNIKIHIHMDINIKYKKLEFQLIYKYIYGFHVYYAAQKARIRISGMHNRRHRHL